MPMMQTFPVAVCPACGAENFDPAPLELQACTACGLVSAAEFADPDALYVDGYYSGETDFGLNVLDPDMQDFLVTVGDRRFDRIERFTDVGSILDVGCGTGEMLAAATRRGWVAGGAEPIDHSAQVARDRGLDVRSAYLADAGFDQDAWDVVSAFHVLEHMTDGVSFLREISKWAKPGGLVVVEVPNWDSRQRLTTGKNWIHLRPLEHVAHYTRATLTDTLARAGLEPVDVSSANFVWSRQLLSEQLREIGHQRWHRYLRRLGSTDDQRGRPTDPVPSTAVHRLLRAVAGRVDRRDGGAVVLGVARRPI